MSKRNYTRKMSKNNWKAVLISVIACLICVPILFNITDGFDNLDFKNNFVRDLNEENYFYQKIVDGEIFDNPQIDAIADNGVIRLNGEIINTNPNAITQSKSISLGNLTLPAGEYTFTCFNSPDIKSHYAVGIYAIDGVSYTWYADFDKSPMFPDSETQSGRTLRLTQETEIQFAIRLVEGAKLNNVKACPVLVEGRQAGSLYVGLFD